MTETGGAVAVPVCGIGASAGGVEALQQFFGALAPDLGLGLRRHRPSRSRPQERAAGDSGPLDDDAGACRSATASRHRCNRITSTSSPRIASSRSPIRRSAPRRSNSREGSATAIDLFFRSLAVAHGDGFAVLLSGSGSDGALGARAVKESGGLILVQDPGEATHSGMPRAAIATGVADVVLPVRELAVRLRRAGQEQAADRHRSTRPSKTAAPRRPTRTRRSRACSTSCESAPGTTSRSTSAARCCGASPGGCSWRTSTRSTSTSKFLRASVSEPQALLNDLLISVTTFFRDPRRLGRAPGARHRAARRAVRSRHAAAGLGARLRDRGRGVQRWRCCSARSSSGAQRPPGFIVFASDVDESALAVAREGVYPHAISADVSDVEARAVFPAGGRSLPGDARRARSSRVRRAQPAARSAVLPACT